MIRERYFKELAIVLQKEGFTPLRTLVMVRITGLSDHSMTYEDLLEQK